LARLLFFSNKDLAVIIAIGLITGILDDKVEMLEFAVVARIHFLVLVNDYIAFKAGGPAFGDLLETWLEFGGVVAACLVRKPAAGMLALTINGACQVFLNGAHDPHLLYGAPGLGADLVFGLFRYRRYDVPVITLAGISTAMFWYPIVWFTHGVYTYPPIFILVDLALRILGSAVGDGLIAGAVALVIFKLVVGGSGRRWSESRPLTFGTALQERETTRLADASGLLVASLAILLIVATRSIDSVSSFFLSIGPKIPPGIKTMEEYNPGYIIALTLIFLVLAMLALWRLRYRYSSS
jgi:ABC-type thiamin/hydroxymethylpyrimidine transport system permease subunit